MCSSYYYTFYHYLNMEYFKIFLFPFNFFLLQSFVDTGGFFFPFVTIVNDTNIIQYYCVFQAFYSHIVFFDFSLKDRYWQFKSYLCNYLDSKLTGGMNFTVCVCAGKPLIDNIPGCLIVTWLRDRRAPGHVFAPCRMCWELHGCEQICGLAVSKQPDHFSVCSKCFECLLKKILAFPNSHLHSHSV